MAADVLRITRAERRSGERVDLVEVELWNGSATSIGPGGLLMRVESAWNYRYRLSAANYWPLEPGESVLTSVALPSGSLKNLEFVSYVETGGRVHALGSKLAFGWVFSNLVEADER